MQQLGALARWLTTENDGESTIMYLLEEDHQQSLYSGVSCHCISQSIVTQSGLMGVSPVPGKGDTPYFRKC